MERRVLIDHWQKVTQEDFENFGIFPQESLDHVVGDLGIKTKAYTGFATAQSAASEVTVGAGRLYVNSGDGAQVYYNADAGGVAISMLGHLPVATRRIVTLTAYANETDTETEPRTFLVDADTRATVARPVPTVRMRRAEVAPVWGIEAPDPVPPAIPANSLAFAYVYLDTTGVDEIVMVEENRASSVEDLALSDKALNLWRNTVGQRLDTLTSDLAALGARLRGTAQLDFVRRLAADLANAKEQLDLPEDYASWGADYFLDTDKSDTTHVDYLARIQEGIRFPPASEGSAQISLLNPVDPNVISQDNFVLPAYTETPRLSVRAPVGGLTFEQSISQFPFQSTTMRQMRRTRMRVRYGGWFLVGSSSGWWASGRFDSVAGLFFLAGDVYEVTYDPNQRITGGQAFFRFRQVWVDYIEEVYWITLAVTRTVNGSVLGESFLNSQDGWLVGINLYFTRKATTGDVAVSICETTDSGTPDVNRVVAYTSLPAADIKVNGLPTKVLFTPTFLTKGADAKRYAIVLHTAGNHYVQLVEGNRFAQGTLFYSTDAGFYQGDLTKDLAFDLIFARFNRTRTEVQLNPLTLSGGIANIDILAEAIKPNGTNIVFEIQIGGIWYSLLEAGDPPPLNTLPPLLPWRAVLLGSTESMPGIGTGSNSRVLTSRPRSDFRHISAVRTLPAPTTSIDAEFRFEGWRGAPYHTATIRLMTGAGYTTLTAPSVIEDIIPPDDPTGAIIRRCHWTLGGAVSSFKLRIEGTTDNVLTCYHVARRTDVET